MNKKILIYSLLVLSKTAYGNSEIVEDIKYVSNDGFETISQILCKNSNKAFIYENNATKEIRMKYDSLIEDLGKVTIDEVIEKVCQ